MKNHIKNYIKIMGLATVPFGTAQATDYEIKVTQEHKPDSEHFNIVLQGNDGIRRGVRVMPLDVVWPHDSEYPIPCDTFLVIRIYDDAVSMEKGAELLEEFAFKNSQLFEAVQWACDYLEFCKRNKMKGIDLDRHVRILQCSFMGFKEIEQYLVPLVPRELLEQFLHGYERDFPRIVSSNTKKHKNV